jgi:hypothetical protein
MTGLKEKLENHLGLVIGAFVIASFAAGFGAYKTLLEISNQEVVAKGMYLPKDKCQEQASLGFSQERLAASLLNFLRLPAKELASAAQDPNHCYGSYVIPQAKVEILAYLNAGDRALRHKAILAYAGCASGINEAYLLARTIKPAEDPANYDAYALALRAMIKHTGRASDFEQMTGYLSEINAPSGIAKAFNSNFPLVISDRDAD